jgi:hypothetical protein
VAVEGVAMVPTSRAFRASCQRAADQLGFAVPCPELLPVPASGPEPARLCDAAELGACQDELLWSQRGTFVTLALRGPSEANQRLAVVLAGRLRLVPPG